MADELYDPNLQSPDLIGLGGALIEEPREKRKTFAGQAAPPIGDRPSTYNDVPVNSGPSLPEDVWNKVRQFAMPRGSDFTHSMDEQTQGARALRELALQNMKSGNAAQMLLGGGQQLLGTALPALAPIGATFEAGLIKPAERTLGPAGRQAADVLTWADPATLANPLSKAAKVAGDAAPYAAMFLGPKAATADLGALTRAQEMKAAGRSADEVKGQTQWIQDEHGNWMFEVPDTNMKFVTDPATGERKFVHPEVEAAYPQFGSMNQEFNVVPTSRGTGEFDISRNRIAGTAANEEALRPIAGHEIQHFVQEMEDWPRGANPDSPRLKTYHGLLMQEAQNAYQSIDDQMNAFAKKQMGLKSDSDLFDPRYETELDVARQQWLIDHPEEAQRFNEANYVLSNIRTPYDLYQHEYGEMLARATQNRINMTAEERANTPIEYRTTPSVKYPEGQAMDPAMSLTSKDIYGN